MRELTRRDVLAGATALGAVAVAGCVADDDDDDPEGEPDGGAGDELDLELVETGITTLSADCGDDDLVEATVEGSSLVLDGTVPSADPCHEAVLDADLTDGALSAGVTLEEDLPDEGTCAQCTGVVEYEATLELSEEISDLSVFESVTVEHGGRSGETHRIEEAGTVAGAAARGDEASDTDETGDADEPRDTAEASDDGGVVTHSVVTTDTGCTSGTGGGRPERVDADEDVTTTQREETVTVEGAVVASTPCHEAIVESASYNAGTLSLVVDTQSTLGDDEMCMECLGEVEYEVTVELTEGTTVDDISVTHIEPVLPDRST